MFFCDCVCTYVCLTRYSQYVTWVDTNDADAMWQDEPSCAEYNYKNDMDEFKG
jgi:hypothetical protein